MPSEPAVAHRARSSRTLYRSISEMSHHTRLELVETPTDCTHKVGTPRAENRFLAPFPHAAQKSSLRPAETQPFATSSQIIIFS